MCEENLYGMLPNDLQQMVGLLYHLPLMDIVDNHGQSFTLIIKYPHMTLNINILSIIVNYSGVESCPKTDFLTIKNFIKELKTGCNTEYENHYGDDEFINITVKDKNIRITTPDIDLILSKDNKGEFIKVMEKYYNLLLKYPQY